MDDDQPEQNFSMRKLDCWFNLKMEVVFKIILENSFTKLDNNFRKQTYGLAKSKYEFLVDMISCSDFVFLKDKLQVRANATKAVTTAEMCVLDRRTEVLEEVCEALEEYNDHLKRLVKHVSPIGSFMKRTAKLLRYKEPLLIIKRYNTLTRVKQESIEEYEHLSSQMGNIREQAMKDREGRGNINMVLGNRKNELLELHNDVEEEITETNKQIELQIKFSNNFTRILFSTQVMIDNIYDKLTSMRGKPAKATTMMEKLVVIQFRMIGLIQSFNDLCAERQAEITEDHADDDDIARYSLPSAVYRNSNKSNNWRFRHSFRKTAEECKFENRNAIDNAILTNPALNRIFNETNCSGDGGVHKTPTHNMLRNENSANDESSNNKSFKNIKEINYATKSTRILSEKSMPPLLGRRDRQSNRLELMKKEALGRYLAPTERRLAPLATASKMSLAPKESVLNDKKFESAIETTGSFCHLGDASRKRDHHNLSVVSDNIDSCTNDKCPNIESKPTYSTHFTKNIQQICSRLKNSPDFRIKSDKYLNLTNRKTSISPKISSQNILPSCVVSNHTPVKRTPRLQVMDHSQSILPGISS